MKVRLLILLLLVSAYCFAQDNAAAHTSMLEPEHIDIYTFDPSTPVGDEVKAFAATAYDAYGKGDFETAAKYYMVYLKSYPQDANSWYNLACCFGLMDKPNLAAKYLKLAYKAGFNNVDHIRKDKDFDKVKTNKTFSGVVDSIITWSEKKTYYTGKMEYFGAKTLLPYWIHLPKNYDADKSYTLLIGLHGFGGKANNFSALWKYLEDDDVIFVVPEAPYAFTEGENAAFSWEPFVQRESKTSLKAFNWLDDYITDLAEQIRKQYRVKQTWLFGFSQGAYYGYMLALKNPKDFDGLIACGGGLVTEIFKEKDYKASKKMKIIISHGTNDNVVAFTEGQKAYDVLKKKGLNVILQTFEGAHSIDPKVFNTFKEMLK